MGYPVHSYGSDQILDAFRRRQEQDAQSQKDLYDAILGHAQMGALDQVDPQLLQQLQKANPARAQLALTLDSKVKADAQIKQQADTFQAFDKALSVYNGLAAKDNPALKPAVTAIGRQIDSYGQKLFNTDFGFSTTMLDAADQKKKMGEVAVDVLNEKVQNLSAKSTSADLAALRGLQMVVAKSGYLNKDEMQAVTSLIEAQVKTVSEEKMRLVTRQQQIADQAQTRGNQLDDRAYAEGQKPLTLYNVKTGAKLQSTVNEARSLLSDPGAGWTRVQPMSKDERVGFGLQQEPSALTEATAKELGKDVANSYQSYLKEGMAAKKMNMDLEPIYKLIQEGKITTGFGQGTLLGIRRLGKAVGLNQENIADKELVAAVGNRIALMLRNPEGGLGLPGNTSNKDLEFLMAASPGLEKTPEGNMAIIGSFNKVNSFKIAIANEASRLAKENGGVPAEDFNAKIMEFANNYKVLDKGDKQRIKVAAGVPDIDTWVKEAKKSPQNKGVSEDELRDYYNSKYGD